LVDASAFALADRITGYGGWLDRRAFAQLPACAVVASLLFALAVWLGRWRRPLLLLVVGFGLVFAAGDGRELVHQLDESNAGIAAIAAILIGLHLAIAALAVSLFLGSTDADRSAAAEPAI
jgi:hypothetical protein